MNIRTANDDAFETLRRDYTARFGIVPFIVDARMQCTLSDCPACDGLHGTKCIRARSNSVRDALRWGESSIEACPAHNLVWAVPLMQNQAIVGALVACVPEKSAFAPRRKAPSLDVRRAANGLRVLAERENMTNASALELKRRQYAATRGLETEIHAVNDGTHNAIRELYLREEPALFSAIRSGDRTTARAFLNHILVQIHHAAGEHIELVKSYFLELVASMCRTAVEAGAKPERLLGASFKRMTELAAIRSDEQLAHWLVAVLEHLMDEIHAARGSESPQCLFDAIAYMRRHCGERISRDDAARAAHLSGPYFSSLLRRESGVTFTELLNQMRTDRAAELLVSTDKSLSAIAVETGFNDQSYFTKVFKRHRDVPPLMFRRRSAAGIDLLPGA